MVEFGSASRTAQRTAAFGVWATWKDNFAAPHPDFALFRLGIDLTRSDTIDTVQLPTLFQIEETFQRAAVTIGKIFD